VKYCKSKKIFKQLLKFFLILNIFNIFFVSGFSAYTKGAENETVPKITVETSAFRKIIIRIPDIKNEPKNLGYSLSSLLRRLINYHLFTLALKEPPLPGLKIEEYFLNATFQKISSQKICISGTFSSTFSSSTKEFFICERAKKPEWLVYTLCNWIIGKISSYKGLAFTRIIFVRRISTEDRLYIMDFSKKNLKYLDYAQMILFPKFSFSGEKVAYLVYKKNRFVLKILNLITGNIQIFSSLHICSVPLWLPGDKKLILTIGKEQNIGLYILDLKTKKLTLLLSKKGVLQAGSISRDGNYLALVWDKGAGSQIYIYNLKTHNLQRISYKGKHNISPRFSPKDNKLLYISLRPSGTYLVFYDLKTQTYQELKFSGFIEDPVFSPDGNYILARAKTSSGTGIYLIHLDSRLSFLYLPGKNLLFPDWTSF